MTPSPSDSQPTSGFTAIAIVGFQNAADIRHCLEALEGSADPAFRVLVCENGGRDAFAALVAALEPLAPAVPDPVPAGSAVVAQVWRGRLPGGQIVEVLGAADNLGYAGGVNAVIDRLSVHPDWQAVWVLNPDTRPDGNALSALVAKAASDPTYGIVGSRLVLQDTGAIQAYGGRWRKYTARGYNIGLGRPADAPVDGDAVERAMSYVLGASMYVTRPFITEIGGMTEDYFLYVEEVDWCLRRGRFRLGFAPESIVHHLHGGTLGSSVTRRNRSRLSVYLDERNKHLVSRRLFPHLYPLIVVTTLIFTAQYLRARALRNFMTALSGWWAGVTGETGKPAWMRR